MAFVHRCGAVQNSSYFNSKFLVLNAQFLVLNTKLLVLNAEFMIFTHLCKLRVSVPNGPIRWCDSIPDIERVLYGARGGVFPGARDRDDLVRKAAEAQLVPLTGACDVS